MFTRRVTGVLVLTLLACASSAAAQYRMERQLMLRPGGTFTLDSDVGSVTVTGDSPSGAAVSIESRIDDFANRFDVQFQETGDGAVVRIKRRSSGIVDRIRDGLRGNTRMTIHVPRSTSTTISTSGGSIQAAALGNVRLRTSGGSIGAEEIAGRAELKTSGGSITARGIGADLDADTSGGGIRIAQVRGAVRASTSGGSIEVDTASGDIDATTSGGGVRVRGAGGRVDAHTSGGSVEVAFTPGNGRGGDLSTSGGGIAAAIDPTVKLSIDAASSGGGVRADVPITINGTLSRRTLKGDLNGGGPLLRIRTSGGGVRIAAAR
jgi:hypothetical protein